MKGALLLQDIVFEQYIYYWGWCQGVTCINLVWFSWAMSLLLANHIERFNIKYWIISTDWSKLHVWKLKTASSANAIEGLKRDLRGTTAVIGNESVFLSLQSKYCSTKDKPLEIQWASVSCFPEHYELATLWSKYPYQLLRMPYTGQGITKRYKHYHEMIEADQVLAEQLKRLY